MRRAFVTAVGALIMAVTFSGSAVASTLTFDDIASNSQGIIPNGYGGLQWNQMGYVDGATSFADSGYENGTVSGSYVAFNNNALVATVYGTTFDFNSAYLTAAWNNGLNITVTGMLGATSLYTQTVTVDTTAPTFFAFNYLGIDQLIFSSSGGTNAGLGFPGTHFAMDDMSVNLAAVPDGGSALAMLGLGMVGISAIRRKSSI
jgi:hypothetical protein